MIANANNALLGIAPEVTENTAVAVTPIVFSEVDITEDPTLVENDLVDGLDAAVDQEIGTKKVSGSLKTNLNYAGFEQLLKCLFPAAVEGVYFRPNRAVGADSTTIQPSFTLIRKFTKMTDTPSYTYTGCRGKQLVIDIDGSGGPIPVSLGIEGIAETAGGAVTEPAAPVMLNNPHVTSIKEGGSALPSGTKLTITVDFGIDPDIAFCIGTGGRRKTIDVNKMSVTVALTALFADMTMVTKAKARTESSLEVVLLNGTKQLTIGIPKLKWQPLTPPVKGKKGILVQYAGRGFVSTSSDKIITFKPETVGA